MLKSCLYLVCMLCSLALAAQDQLSQTRLDRLYSKGIELIHHQQFGGARQQFAEFLRQANATDSRYSEALYYEAFSAVSLNNPDGEKKIAQFIYQYPSDPRSVTAYADLGEFFYNQKNYEKAITYFKKVDISALSTDHQSRIRFEFGYSYFNQKKLDQALPLFNEIKVQGNAYAPAAQYYAGFIELSQGQYEEAWIDFKAAEVNASYANVVPPLIATTLFKQKKYKDVIEYAKKQEAKKDKVNGLDQISLLKAESYYYSGDFQNAASAYESYLATYSPKAESGVLFRAGYSNYSIQKDPIAIEYLKNAAALNDSISYYASYYLGVVYLRQGNKPLAVNAFDYAHKYSQDKALAEESHFQFAKVSYDAGQADLAISEFEKFIQQYPGSSHTQEVKELLAQAYVNGNNYHKALEYIESLPVRNETINRAYQKASFLKGMEQFNKEDYEGARVSFENSLKHPLSKSYEALSAFWAGEAYASVGQDAKAVELYQRVISLGETADAEMFKKARYAMGYSWFNQQQYENALFNFKDFVNREKAGSTTYQDALIRLADCYYVKKSFDESLKYYQQARQAGATDLDYLLLQTGMIYGSQRKYADASNQFSLLIKSYPKSVYRDEALFQKAQFDIEQGNYQASVETLSQLIREGSQGSKFLPYAHMRRAAAFYNLKQYDKTVLDYQHVLRQYPSHPVSQQALLPLQEAMNLAGQSGNFEDVLDQYKKANPDNKNLESIEFETAKSLYFNQQYQKASERLLSFVSAYPASAKLTEAKYYAAESYFRLREFDKALVYLQEVSGDPTFSQLNRAMSRKAEIQFKKSDYSSAITSYRQLEKIASNKREQNTAWLGMVESFYLLGQYDSADLYAKTILTQGAINETIQNKASLYLGKIAKAKGDYETAKDEFLTTLNTARDESGAEAKYLLGEIQYLTKKHKECYETLISLNEDFKAYENWVGKSFLLLADNYVAQNEIFQAKATLQSLIDHFPQETVKATARERLLAIEQQQAEKNKVTDSTEQK